MNIGTIIQALQAYEGYVAVDNIYYKEINNKRILVIEFESGWGQGTQYKYWDNVVKIWRDLYAGNI